MAAARKREAELAAECDDSPADPSGRWSAKDHLIHLSSWRDYSASVLDAARTGNAENLRPPDDQDVINARVYAANKDRGAAEIKREAHASWERLEAAISACSEEDLVRPHPRSPGRPVWQTVPANGHGHVAEHLMFRHLDEGDEKAAEEVQLWAHDVDFAAFIEPQPRAYSDYNLACFYARVGRAGRAAELLRRSFEAAPDLKVIAAHDHDLDRVRDEEEVREVLAG